MNRGRGVTLQMYKDGGLSDARVYVKKEGVLQISKSGMVSAMLDAIHRDIGGRRGVAVFTLFASSLSTKLRCRKFSTVSTIVISVLVSGANPL